MKRRRNRKKKGEIDVQVSAVMAITPRAATAPQTDASLEAIKAGNAVIAAALAKHRDSLGVFADYPLLMRTIERATTALAKSMLKAGGEIRQKHTAALDAEHRRRSADQHWAGIIAAIHRHEVAGRGRNESIRAVFNAKVAATGQTWEAFRRAAYRRLAE